MLEVLLPLLASGITENMSVADIVTLVAVMGLVFKVNALENQISDEVQGIREYVNVSIEAIQSEITSIRDRMDRIQGVRS